MNTVNIDDTLRAILSDSPEPVELCDETGWPLGYFLPPSAHANLLQTWARTHFGNGLSPRPEHNGIQEAALRSGPAKLILPQRSLPFGFDLYAQGEWLDLCGTPLGYYLPFYDDEAARQRHKQVLYQQIQAQISDEDVEQARQQQGGQPLTEIWKSLGQP